MTANANEVEEDSFLKVWLTRILVTVAIALLLEYLGKQPVPSSQGKDVKEKEDVEQLVTMQYAELSSSGTGADLADGQAEKEDAKEQDGNAAPMESENSNDEEELYDDEENEEEEQQQEEEVAQNASSGDEKGTPEATSNIAETTPQTESSPTETTTNPLKFKNKLNCHPGMDGYHHWYDIETSLFRQYNVGRTDDVDVIPPYVPKSRNGQVRVALRVTNHYAMKINVYWINYKGHEDYKGTIVRGETWYQTTYVEHPWVFRLAQDNDTTHNNGELEPLLLHYIPERVIPHLDEAPTIEDEHPMVGVQRFSIRAPTDQALREHFICSIDDPILPHPANHHFHNPHQAHNWTLLHMKRLGYFDYNPSATVLTKYLTNIAMHPSKAHYRHIRIANKKFATAIWNTPARGLLLAAGFKEQHAYAELGIANETLSNELVQDVSLALYRLEQCLIDLGQSASSSSGGTARQQPDGADGQGRAGFRIR